MGRELTADDYDLLLGLDEAAANEARTARNGGVAGLDVAMRISAIPLITMPRVGSASPERERPVAAAAAAAAAGKRKRGDAAADVFVIDFDSPIHSRAPPPLSSARGGVIELDDSGAGDEPPVVAAAAAAGARGSGSGGRAAASAARHAAAPEVISLDDSQDPATADAGVLVAAAAVGRRGSGTGGRLWAAPAPAPAASSAAATTAAAEDGTAGNEDCSICRDDMPAGSKVKLLECLHRFHGPCIDQWLHVSMTCPICKHKAARLFLASYSVKLGNSLARKSVARTPESAVMAAAGEQTAIFAGGCFWCIEASFNTLRGVRAFSGYIGGSVENPSYEAVCTGTTGAAEAVQVLYDPAVISYDKLLKLFFTVHDPTQLNRQGNDVGTQYRSGIYYLDDAQRDAAKAYIARIAPEYSSPIVTEVVPATRFWPAEEYHQRYFEKNPGAGYCQAVVSKKVKKAKEHFAGDLK